MFETHENKEAAAFANEFLKRYIAVGFGALSKREVDLMLLQLLQDHMPGLKTRSDFDTAIFLKTTKRKVRGLRDEISFREGHSHSATDLKASLREVLLTAEVISIDKAMVMIQIDDAVLKGFAEQIVRSEFGIIDSSFNSAILKLSGEKFLLLAFSVLNDAEKIEAEKVISEISTEAGFKPDRKKSSFAQFKGGFSFGAGQRAGQLCVSGGLALLTGGASIMLEGGEFVKATGKGIGAAIRQVHSVFNRAPKT